MMNVSSGGYFGCECLFLQIGLPYCYEESKKLHRTVGFSLLFWHKDFANSTA